MERLVYFSNFGTVDLVKAEDESMMSPVQAEEDLQGYLRNAWDDGITVKSVVLHPDVYAQAASWGPDSLDHTLCCPECGQPYP